MGEFTPLQSVYSAAPARVNFISVNHRVKIKESEKIDDYLDLARELKKQWNGFSRLQKLKKYTKGIGNQRKNQDHPKHSSYDRLEYSEASKISQEPCSISASRERSLVNTGTKIHASDTMILYLKEVPRTSKHFIFFHSNPRRFARIEPIFNSQIVREIPLFSIYRVRQDAV